MFRQHRGLSTWKNIMKHTRHELEFSATVQVFVKQCKRTQKGNAGLTRQMEERFQDMECQFNEVMEYFKETYGLIETKVMHGDPDMEHDDPDVEDQIVEAPKQSKMYQAKIKQLRI